MKPHTIHITVNGIEHTLEVSANKTLVELLRNDLGLMGTKFACGEGECGACTVIMNGNAVLSCLMLAVEADGCAITTIEGISNANDVLHPIQQSFIDKGAVQCGFCTPGMILSAKALLDKNPEPDRAQIQQAINGNICRCTGYVKIIEAIEDAVRRTSTKGSRESTR